MYSHAGQGLALECVFGGSETLLMHTRACALSLSLSPTQFLFFSAGGAGDAGGTRSYKHVFSCRANPGTTVCIWGERDTTYAYARARAISLLLSLSLSLSLSFSLSLTQTHNTHNTQVSTFCKSIVPYADVC
jgi:hypothetical protein